MRDGINLARAGIPVVALVTSAFWAQGSFVAQAAGMKDVPRLELPHPVAGTGAAAMADLASTLGLSPKAHAFLNSQYGNMAYQRRVQGEQAIIMNADDAETRNIQEGQPVRVFNENGELQGVARIGAGDTRRPRGRHLPARALAQGGGRPDGQRGGPGLIIGSP